MKPAMSEGPSGVEILLVDDESEILGEMAQWLSDSELPCATAVSGAEALEVLRMHPEIRLVVTDVRMPGMDGYQLVEAARLLHEPLPSRRFIMVTGHLTASDHARIGSFGVEGLLSKPIDLEELETMIRNALGASEREPEPGAKTGQ